MVSSLRRPRLTLPLAATSAGVIGGAVALLFALIPVASLESLVLASGLPAIVAAAEPPLGATARATLILIGGGIVALLFWAAFYIAFGDRHITVRLPRRARGEDDAPVLRRADAHPDAPARAPLVASRDLGTPFLEIHAKMPDPILDEEFEQGFAEAEAVVPAAPLPLAISAPAPEPRALPEPLPIMAPVVLVHPPRTVPDDLDTPIAEFDPQAFEAAARNPHPRFAPGERIETFDLRPPVPSVPVPPPARAPRDTEATITALLERLERGVSQRASRAPAAAPRRLATGG